MYRQGRNFWLRRQLILVGEANKANWGAKKKVARQLRGAVVIAASLDTIHEHVRKM